MTAVSPDPAVWEDAVSFLHEVDTLLQVPQALQELFQLPPAWGLVQGITVNSS